MVADEEDWALDCIDCPLALPDIERLAEPDGATDALPETDALLDGADTAGPEPEPAAVDTGAFGLLELAVPWAIASNGAMSCRHGSVRKSDSKIERHIQSHRQQCPGVYPHVEAVGKADQSELGRAHRRGYSCTQQFCQALRTPRQELYIQ